MSYQRGLESLAILNDYAEGSSLLCQRVNDMALSGSNRLQSYLGYKNPNDFKKNFTLAKAA
jgi:hypothetical protein